MPRERCQNTWGDGVGVPGDQVRVPRERGLEWEDGVRVPVERGS